MTDQNDTPDARELERLLRFLSSVDVAAVLHGRTDLTGCSIVGVPAHAPVTFTYPTHDLSPYEQAKDNLRRKGEWPYA